ncbi:methionine adenosyltransferase [Spiroplasma endosymbiont of Aspidapion aeneum]|uniref:methionine adenosyltransferase n=1 Tax=Spiroplasma endosymbiont of Aspidapion aeneum TaxID=3066276 RepID=UPI00313CF340
MKNLFTSEAVSEGHPDKLCDQISDAILDECLLQDVNSRCAVECFFSNELLVIGGEISTMAKINYEKIARDIIKNVGYDDSTIGVDYRTVEIIINISTQSPDISQGVDRVNEIGAGDQGMMFGFAINETESLMPYPIMIANDLVHIATKLRKKGIFKFAKPDMKSQVTIDYTNKANPRIDTILMSVQHDKNYDKNIFEKFIKDNIMKVIALRYNLNTDYSVLINPTGKFVIGGPKGDTGLTGRKIMVDTYGGFSRHGGGAFSGKDYTKVDRSASYMCRYAAKNIVAAGIADCIEIQVSYAIGVSKPIAIYFETFGTNKISNEVISNILKTEFDFSVGGLINYLDLKNVGYLRTSKYGHFGKKEFPWEKLDMNNKLIKYL